MAEVRVYFLPSGQSAVVSEGVTLLDAMRAASLIPVAPCGGAGSCGQCRVIVGKEYAKALTPVGLAEAEKLTAEELESGVRLACQARVLGALRVQVLAGTTSNRLRLQTERSEKTAEAIGDGEMPFAIEYGISADDSVLEGLLLEGQAPAIDAETGSPKQVTVGFHEGKPQWYVPTERRPLGLAVDLGSTKIAAYLFDLSTKEQWAVAGRPNPQAHWGDDIMSRVAAAMLDQENAVQMANEVRSAIDALAQELCEQASRNGKICSPADIVEAVVVANTVMQHLFLGLDVTGLGVAPFTPADDGPYDASAQAMGLHLHPQARLFMPPPVAGFVGSDHIAMLLGANISRGDEVILAVDIGTNTEVSLLLPDRTVTCSTASGPAFEGAHVSCGMRAGDGAVEKISVEGEGLRCHVIGGGLAAGLCGSGVLDAVACLRTLEILSPQGTFAADHPLVRRGKGGPEAILCPAEKTLSGKDLVLRRADVGAIQLAKGAIRSGIELLMEEAGLAADAIDKVVIAGAFGSYLDLKSAFTIGLFPNLPAERFLQVGNAAGQGAIKILLSQQARQDALALPALMEHCELASMPSFGAVYKRSMCLYEE